MRTVVFWLSLVLIFMIPWELSVSIAGLGTLVKATGLLLTAFWIATVLATGSFRKPHLFHLAVYLFILWNTVSVFWSVDIALTVDRISTYAQLAVLFLILWDIYATPATLKAGLQAYVLGAYVSIASVVANYLSGITSNVWDGRYTGAGLHVDDLALILALGLPVAWHLAVSAENSKTSSILRLVNFAYIPAAFFAILLTGTRGAMIASIPVLVFILGSFARLKISARVLISATLVGALLALLPQIPQTSIDRLAATGASIATGDLTGRVDIWREGLAIFTEHPLLGIGSGAFRTAAVQTNKVAHNTFLSVLAEVGIIGFVLFAIILAMVVYQAAHQPKRDSRFWLTVLLVWAIGVSALTWEQRKPTWLFLSLVVVSAFLSSSREETEPRSEFDVAPFGSPNVSVVQGGTATNAQSSNKPRSIYRTGLLGKEASNGD